MFKFLGYSLQTCAKCIPKEKGFSLPAQYILSRWTINAKKEKAKGLASEDFHEDNNEASGILLFNSVMVESLELYEKASR